MIVEMAIAAVALGVAAAVRARIARRRAPAPVTSELGAALAAARKADRGLVSGDVLMIPGEELALGGSIAVDEGGFVLRAFSLIAAAQDRWLVQLDEGGRDLVLGRDSTLLPEGPVPSELPVSGRMLVLERRGTGRASAAGEGVPAIEGATAPYVVLGERGGRCLVVIDLPGRRVAIEGERLDPRVVDRLGGGAR